MKRLAPAPGARKLALAGVRRRRVPMGEWERRDLHSAAKRSAFGVQILRDQVGELSYAIHDVRRDLRRRICAVDWSVRLIVGVLASAAAVATMHQVHP